MMAALVSAGMIAGASCLAADNDGGPKSAGYCDYDGPMGYGMGPGMMHGWDRDDMGPGMMHGWNRGDRGPGMMHGWGRYGASRLDEIDLNDDQIAKINKIQDESRRTQWTLMGNLMDQQATLRDLSSAHNADPAAVGNAYKKAFALRQQMLENSRDARKRIEAVLTKEQKEKLRSLPRRNW
jgi:Spy/CpxP family protein refolding chaperone